MFNPDTKHDFCVDSSNSNAQDTGMEKVLTCDCFGTNTTKNLIGFCDLFESCDYIEFKLRKI